MKQNMGLFKRNKAIIAFPEKKNTVKDINFGTAKKVLNIVLMVT